ncbi:MAG: glycosyl hydrolase family 30 [Bacteroidetes bacterium]|jgi:glucosylceramidase|nr:glycosyl hydrolase family 30 [Bacteroidota bacterium]
MKIEIYETSAAGNKLTKIEGTPSSPGEFEIAIDPDTTFQTLLGFGGSFTESSAYLLNQLSEGNRKKIIDAYFGPEGAKYSLTRTHINSCDFSLSQYSYHPKADKELPDFSVKEDEDDIIPMIKDAMEVSEDGFKIISSPWTAPPWMKDNKEWVGGKLLPEYYDSWALFFSKYLRAYAERGIDIWGVTVENEPHGNGNNWESMHYTPKEMTDFVEFHLGPQLNEDGWGDIKIFGYDQNRKGLPEWIDEMYRDSASSRYFDGTAIHWYESTYEVFPEELQYAHSKAPDKMLIETEGCIDDEVPHWKDDEWYWSKEATDWGWEWAAEEDKYLHPKYVPVYRYARDIIGCMNNWVEGWIDWNMVLDRQGGPNWFENWCAAPVIVDPEADEVYFTPLYHTMAHFSKFIRPGAKRIKVDSGSENLEVTAAKNPDGSIAVVVLNQGETSQSFSLVVSGTERNIKINPKALQTITMKSAQNESTDKKI